MMLRKWAFWCCMSILSCYADSLGDFLKGFNQKSYVKHASIGLYVANEQGEVLVNYGGEKSLIPNSIVKMLTTAASLDQLGDRFQFCTKLYVKGIVKEGVLYGDVIICGDGDPTFASEDYQELFKLWARKLSEHSIRVIQGNVIGDASCFEKALAPSSWLLEDVGNYYGAGACGLNFHENMYTMVLRLGRQLGDPTTMISVFPSFPHVEICNEVVSGPKGSGDRAAIFGGEYSTVQHARGSVPLDKPIFTLKGSIPNPPLSCAQCLIDVLKEHQISVRGDATATFEKLDYGDAICIDSVYSGPLSELIKETNQRSQNLYAESLLKKMGQGSLYSGLEMLKKYIQSLSVSLEGCHLADGSGLSNKNLLTAKTVVDFLSKVASKPYFPSFYTSLPSNESQTYYRLTRMFSSSKLEGKVQAKTGYSSQGESVAGFLTTQKGERLRFCFIANHQAPYHTEWRLDIQKLLELLVD